MKNVVNLCVFKFDMRDEIINSKNRRKRSAEVIRVRLEQMQGLCLQHKEGKFLENCRQIFQARDQVFDEIIATLLRLGGTLT